MIGFDRDALICDLAETYHIYDYRSLPVKLVATLSSGLRENSRIKTKMRGEQVPVTDSLLAMIYDILAGFLWNGGGKPPESAYDRLNGIEHEKPEKNFETFDSPEDYLRERERIIGEIECQEQH